MVPGSGAALSRRRTVRLWCCLGNSKCFFGRHSVHCFCEVPSASLSFFFDLLGSCSLALGTPTHMNRTEGGLLRPQRVVRRRRLLHDIALAVAVVPRHSGRQ